MKKDEKQVKMLKGNPFTDLVDRTSLAYRLAESLYKSVVNRFPDVPLIQEDIVWEHPKNSENGDYSTNVAMRWQRLVAQTTKSHVGGIIQAQNKDSFYASPQELALALKLEWEKNKPKEIENVEAVGGFLNIWLNNEYLSKQTVEVLEKNEVYGKSLVGKGKTVVIDYSAPNIAKPFGIGHLRSTNIGQALYNLYQVTGWTTIGDNHLGDWGTQFGKLIYQIKAKNLVEKLIDLTVMDLEKLYVEYHDEAEHNPEMDEEARKWFKKLEAGDVEANDIWQKCIAISWKEFDRVYDILGVKIDYALGESFYLDKMQEVIDEAKVKKIAYESQGALVIDIPGEKTPLMLIKSDGATTYATRDLATIKYRIKTWQPDLYIYEVGADQVLHFRQVFAVAELLGYGSQEQFKHMAHGMIRWATGKFSTRSGDTIHLEDVLNEAISRARKLCDSAGVGKDLTGKEKDSVAKMIGIGAVKYNDLKQNPSSDIIFDWDTILTLSGNSAPYLQYTYARTQSILKKSKINLPAGKAGNQKSNLQIKNEINLEFNKEELALMRTIYQFPEVIVQATKEFAPNLICNYLFDLAQKFNVFYDKHRILTTDYGLGTRADGLQTTDYGLRQTGGKTTAVDGSLKAVDGQSSFRLILTSAVGQVIKNGLTLLGIESPERM